MYELFICFLTSILIPMVLYMLSYYLFMSKNLNRNKISSFECGFDPFLQARLPFSTRFFLLGIIFIVFDIEIVLLMPMPLMTQDFFFPPMISFLLFCFILLVGLVHEWNEGSLDWAL